MCLCICIQDVTYTDMIYSTNIIDLTKMAYETLWVRIKYFHFRTFRFAFVQQKIEKKKRGLVGGQCSFFGLL